jgi:hypothetical protein
MVSSSHICYEFKVAEYLVQTKRNIIKVDCVLPSFTHKTQRGKRISDSVLSHLTSFYENDECSRIYPGVKDLFVYETVNCQRTQTRAATI